MEVLGHLEPKAVMHWFEVISAIPHGSLKEEKLSARIMAFAKEKGYACCEDAHHNVLVRKPASPGYEGKDPVILQAHIDMIWAKEKDVDFDFETEGLKLRVVGDRIMATGTTLGADDGIGAAFMLAVLDDETLPHPPIEAVFTTAEEIGMIGAIHFDMSQLTATRMINFDAGGFTEGRIYVGCAGNQRAILRQKLAYAPCSADGRHPVRIAVSGLQGGHSGGDITKGRGNSTLIIGRLLRLLLAMDGTDIAYVESGDITQGNKHGIPGEGHIIACVRNTAAVCQAVQALQTTLRDELSDVDDGVTLTVQEEAALPGSVLERRSAETIAQVLALLPNGVQSMQRLFPDTPECSCNTGSMEIVDGVVTFYNSIRSCKASLIEELTGKYRTIAALTGCDVSFSNRLPGWDYDKNSPIKKLVEEEYLRQFGRAPRFKVTHAGTECAMFKERLPKVDIISMGPIIYEEHTPKEWMGIESIGILWEFLKNILRQL